mgnify:CR=1 FL=1
MNKYSDVYGEVLSDFLQDGTLTSPLLLHGSYGYTEDMPVDVFFREEEDFPEQELIALYLCDGRVLDIGAGVGRHSLYLQNRGFDVTALEISEMTCAIMRQRGVKQVLHQDLFLLNGVKYDTLLLLMNGIGLVQTIDGLRHFLQFAKTLLTECGQILFDSSDISYLYEDGRVPKPTHYFGEIGYQYEYKGKKGKPFKWLYIDQETLIKIAHEENWVVQILYEDDEDQYLARMEPRTV